MGAPPILVTVVKLILKTIKMMIKIPTIVVKKRVVQTAKEQLIAS